MLRRWLPSCVVVIGAFATNAHAESSPSDFGPSDWSPPPETVQSLPVVHREAGYRDHPLHVELIFGGDTRVGELGGSLEYALGDPLSVGIGMGGNSFGPEWDVHARLRPVWWRTPNGSFFHALTIEGSMSVATFGSPQFILGDVCDDCPDTSVAAQTVYWAQGELGWEGMLRNGFTFRASSGFAQAVGTRRWQCESGNTSQCVDPSRLLYVQTFALGVAF